jgi:hypothetical protein
MADVLIGTFIGVFGDQEGVYVNLHRDGERIKGEFVLTLPGEPFGLRTEVKINDPGGSDPITIERTLANSTVQNAVLTKPVVPTRVGDSRYNVLKGSVLSGDAGGGASGRCEIWII